MLNEFLLVVRVLSDCGDRVGLAKMQLCMAHVSKYRCKKLLKELCALGFVRRVGNQYELTSGGRALYNADSVAWSVSLGVSS